MAWFSGWRKRSITRISMDELRRERIGLEQEETRLIKKVEELEHQKKLLFQEGANKNSQREQVMLARRIKELDTQAKNHDSNLRVLSRQMRVIHGFIQIKENQKYFDQMGVSSVIAKMDTESLQRYMEKMMVENQLRVDKFAEVLSALEDSEGLIEGGGEDADTLRLVELMNEARAAQQENPEEAMEKTYHKVDQTLRSKTEAEPM